MTLYKVYRKYNNFTHDYSYVFIEKDLPYLPTERYMPYMDGKCLTRDECSNLLALGYLFSDTDVFMIKEPAYVINTEEDYNILVGK